MVGRGRSLRSRENVAGFEPAVVGFDPIVRIVLGVVKRGRDQLLDDRS
jgi:hypothetical protein